MAEASTVGEIIEKSSSFKEIIWKIDKIFSLSSEEGYKFRSPTFHFVGVNCNLSVCPNGTMASPGTVIVSLFLRMTDWKHESPPVICEMGLRTKSNTLFKGTTTEKSLKNGVFKTCYFCKKEILSNTELKDENESLSIFCKLTVGENYRKEEASQTETQIKSINGEWFFVDAKNGIEISYPKEVYVQTEQTCMGVEKVLDDLKKLLDSEDDSDVTIKVKEKEFKAHRNILSTRTPVFAAMFKHDMLEKNTGNIPLDDCEPQIFKDFLHYVYTGTVDSLSRDNVFGLYEISDKYQVDDLKKECLDCLKDILSVDTFCEVLTLALKYSEQELLTLATALFCKKMNEIIITIKWQTFMCENPTYVNELLIKRVQYESNQIV